MRTLWERGIDLPAEPNEYRGSGEPLNWDET